jgi:hypothetical protein
MRQSTYFLACFALLLAVLMPLAVIDFADRKNALTSPAHDGAGIVADTGAVPQANIFPKTHIPVSFDVTAPDLSTIPWHDPLELRALIPEAINKTVDWHIYKTEWSKADELGYIAFVSAIGRASCFTIDECLRDPANPYRDLEDDFIWLGDCADMVYMLRGYYAWKNGLPFSYQNRAVTADGAREDLRYSRAGNIITGRRNATTPLTGKPVNAQKFLNRMRGEVSTAMFRNHPVTGTRGTYDDFYPIEIARNAIRPGSLAYDIHGHVGIVYQIEKDGRILIIAAHPDQTVTRSWYGPNFQRSGPEKGSGLKAWRPTKLVGARKTSKGTYIGGIIVGAENDDLPDFSMVQYEGTKPLGDRDNINWQAADFIWKGRTLNYFDYVRRALSEPGLPIDPVSEFRETLQLLCADTKARRLAVNIAARNKIYDKKHPKRLPANIFGTYGLWEAFSTPSRDARLKTSFVEALRVAREMITRHRLGDEEILFEGSDLPRTLLRVYFEETAACEISYRRMDGTYVVMDLSHVNQRLFDLSFDPYHCPERRWGARGLELATCRETPEKAEWYEAQRFLRNQAHRSYDQFTGFTLAELKSPAEALPDEGGIGALTPPNVDIHGFLLEEIKKQGSVLAGETSVEGGGQ